MNAPNAVIEKVRKLLARADESRNDNEHEREIAMRQAHALLARHGLTADDVPDGEAGADNDGALGRMFEETGRPVWIAGIFDQVARLNGCKVIRAARSVRNGSPARVWIVGRRIRCQITRDMARWLTDSITREARKGRHALGQFGSGAWSGIARQVDAILANMARGELDGQQLEPGTALMVVNNHKTALVDAARAVKEFFPHVRGGSGGRCQQGDAYHAGKAYGASVGLHGQVGRANGQRALT